MAFDLSTLVHCSMCPFQVTRVFFTMTLFHSGSLRSFYGAAHVFALASREEGLAVVQVQALASGLPLVCSDRSGGSDLASVPELARLIHVVPVGDPDALRLALIRALDDAMGKTGAAPITEAERQALSWRAYALRDLQFMTGMSKTLALTPLEHRKG